MGIAISHIPLISFGLKEKNVLEHYANITTTVFGLSMICGSVSMTGIYLKQILIWLIAEEHIKLLGSFNTITIINCLTKKPI